MLQTFIFLCVCIFVSLGGFFLPRLEVTSIVGRSFRFGIPGVLFGWEGAWAMGHRNMRHTYTHALEMDIHIDRW